MKPAWIALLLLAASSSARAESEVRLDTLGGVATAPFITSDLPRTSGNGAVLLLGTRLRVRPMLDIGVRLPLALIHVEQPAGSFVSEAAWGNPELFVEHAHALDVSRPMLLRTRMAIGAPLAEHGSNGLMENRALAIADALLGWREHALFVPGVVPITPSAELAIPFRRWSPFATLDVPLLVRVSDAMADDAANAIGVAPVLGLGARAIVTSWLRATAGTYAVFDIARPLAYVDRASRVQVTMHADLAFSIGAGIHLGVTVLVPLGGPLGGETVAAGLSLARR